MNLCEVFHSRVVDGEVHHKVSRCRPHISLRRCLADATDPSVALLGGATLTYAISGLLYV